MEIIYFIIGFIVGSLIFFIFTKLIYQPKEGHTHVDFSKLNETINTLNAEKSSLQTTVQIIKESSEKAEQTISQKDKELKELTSENLKLLADYTHLQEKLTEQKSEIKKLQEKFSIEFENLANKILDEKSSKFTNINRDNISQILAPLNEKIKSFEEKILLLYHTESTERASLKTEIKQLYELNQQITKEANNLTKALKGESVVRGNWGEMVLESILEKSGLAKDREYLVQASHSDSEGKRFRPDIIIKLPENKNIIIDSKVSLNAYEQYCSAENEKEKQTHLNAHINSIRAHIKELNIKSYQNLYGLQSLDFVLMFMPVESALSLAGQNDPTLWSEAFDKNIVIVSPSTLLATLRTISNIWKQEKQNQNAQDIAKQTALLYDKFVGFLNDLTDIGKKIDSAKDSYDSAFNKLKSGKGNLIKQAEKIKELGIKPTKSIPQDILEKADE